MTAVTHIKPGLLSKEFDSLLAEHFALCERADAAKQAHREAQNALTQARSADDLAAAEAARKGDPDPGSDNENAAKAAREECERDERVLTLAVEKSEQAVRDELAAKGPAFIDGLEGQLEKKRTQALTLLSKLQEVMGSGDELRHTVEFIDPSRGQQRLSLAGWRGRVRTVRDAQEKQYSVDALVSALAEHFSIDPRVKAQKELIVGGIPVDIHKTAQEAEQQRQTLIQADNERNARELADARKDGLERGVRRAERLDGATQ